MKNRMILAIGLLLLSSLCVAKNKQVHIEVNVTDIKLSSSAVWSLDKGSVPNYPKDLAISGVEGCAILSFELSPEGKAKDIDVINSVPKKRLGKYAKKLVRKLKWNPLVENVNEAEQRTVRIDFCLAETQEQVAKECIKRVELSCK